MKPNIFVPKKIKVGFQDRGGTYTGKLAYVTYYDEKNTLRKEKSWEGWRDNKIEPLDVDNVPTSGFVLNKKAGGYSTGWNHRQTYVRIYDPRDFEFEITIPNLLYILENTNSIKGKGLEGEFVYGWDGKDLILIPTTSPDYIEIKEYSKLINKANYIKTKDLKIGAIYKTKSNEDWIYMGKFDYHTVDVYKGKYHYFVREIKNWKDEDDIKILTLKSLGQKFIAIESEDCVSNYAELFDKLECQKEYSPYDKTKDEYISYTLEEFKQYIESLNLMEYSWKRSFDIQIKNNENYIRQKIYYDISDDIYYVEGDYSRELGEYIKNIIGTIEDLWKIYQPVYKNEYLKNGKLYRRMS